ncbi:MAG: KamA family radical SAM protein [candidate division KSB1 bacterium]|nr:KamA family radical SAM protein [candidate division KSB1 bacterium]
MSAGVRGPCDPQPELGTPDHVLHVRSHAETWPPSDSPEWRDWRWQLRNAVTRPEQLAELGLLSWEEAERLQPVVRVYPMRVVPYYLSLIDWGDPRDPLRLQALPAAEELVIDPRLVRDPLEEERHSPLPGVVHRYPDRVLLITNTFCPVLCRHCTRKRLMAGRPLYASRSHLEQAIAYIASHPQVHDVLISGGNPLSLSPRRLDWLLRELAALPHVEVIRIGSREPATLPQRVLDPELQEVLRRHRRKLWLNTQFNHPRELTELAAEALDSLLSLGIPVNNQTVLLRGVNDSEEVLYELFRGLLRLKVRPYYLLHADPTQGTSHFRTSVFRGMELVESLRGRLSGLGIPVYVVDSPRLGKLPIVPTYACQGPEGYLELRKGSAPTVLYPDGERGTSP